MPITKSEYYFCLFYFPSFSSISSIVLKSFEECESLLKNSRIEVWNHRSQDERIWRFGKCFQRSSVVIKAAAIYRGFLSFGWACFLIFNFFFSPSPKYYCMYFLLWESLWSEHERRNTNWILISGEKWQTGIPKWNTRLCMINIQRIIAIHIRVSEAWTGSLSFQRWYVGGWEWNTIKFKQTIKPARLHH